MNCKKVQRALPAYLERLLDVETQEALEVHVQACSVCQRELAAYQKTLELAGQIEIEYPSPEAWEQFLPRLYAAIEADQRLPSTSRWARLRERRWIAGIPAALAAMLLFGWLVLQTPFQPREEVPPSPVEVISDVLMSDQEARELAQLTQVPLEAEPLFLPIAELEYATQPATVEWHVDLQQLEQELTLPEEELWGPFALNDSGDLGTPLP